jgi:hypothetical protein
MPGPQGPQGPAGSGEGGSADIADFVFESFPADEDSSADGKSSITIANKDLYIQTTRDDEQDADIELVSADDLRLTANDLVSLRAGSRVVVRTAWDTEAESDYRWVFTDDGAISLPESDSLIRSGIDGTFVTESRDVTFDNDYNGGTNGLNQTSAVLLPVNEDTLWFVNNANDSAGIYFADGTQVQTIAIYDGTSQGTNAVIFQWNTGDLTKTYEETYPLYVFADATGPNSYVSLIANDSEWKFTGDAHMIINNKDMTIETLRDADQDADINIYSADDVFITANGDDIHLDAADDVQITTNIEGDVQYVWEFNQGGEFVFPNETYQITAFEGGATGSFVSSDNKTITVTNGVITGIADIV